ncbi:hypothetical protein JN086_04375 [Mycolicibacterium austroafricanum]|uniref:Uncharacterized protein n=2 Tax=Mycolicibacterium TaxID=1866885 RepID=A0ABT8H9J5_MYCAO|nr:hypothetical protein [Mycolicibacterium austroafricanum]MDN4517419.1 hypothetical protein [Mycolicibacterium austroafricanum]QRZ07611.1 hypothetical protein JN090_03370 [Mycolicibacterium austroafricanum]QZT69274.1 hypothetical protein JN086_04375 [Mycolicibacterium austroafricanum]
MTRLPARIRLRRRLLMASAPPALVAVVVAVKLISVVVVGNSAQTHYASGDIGALSDDVSLLRILDVVQPANTASTAGGLAVLQDRLQEADAQFTDALTRTAADRSCPVRVNLALVREREGDIDAWEARLESARQRYESALAVIAEAPQGCFDGNTDPDSARRAVREDADERITAKIDALGSVVAPLAPPPPPPVEVPAAPSGPPVAGPDVSDPAEARRLDRGRDPLEALRQLLRDAAAG